MSAIVKVELNHSLAVIVCIAGILSLTGAQEPKAKNFMRELRVSNQTPLPFESIGVLVIVSNPSDRALSEFGSWDPLLFWAEQTISPLSWKQYTPDAEPQILPSPPNTLTLGPGQSRIWVRHLDYQWTATHVLKEPRPKLLRAAIGGIYLEPTQIHRPYKELLDKLKSVKIGDEIYSQSIQIMVKNPDGIDRDAYEFLKSSELHKYFSEHTISKYQYTRETIQQLEAFINRFQDSRYAYLARLGLALIWVQGINGKKDPQQAASLLQQVARSSDQVLAPQANYYLGKIAKSQGDIANAQRYYTRALSLNIDPYFKYLTEEAQVQVEQRRR